MILFTLIGIFLCPIFTLGCVLLHYNHDILGIVAIVYSILKITN